MSKIYDKYEKYGAYHWNLYENGDILYSEHVNYIVKNFKKREKGTLLDIGCGDGLLTYLLEQIGFEVKGIDINKKAIEIAQSKCPSINFIIKDIFDEEEQFDYLLASEIIEHLPSDDEFLQKIKNLFIKEILITTPRKVDYRRIDQYHFREYNLEEYKNLLQKYFKNFQIQVSEYHLYGWIRKLQKNEKVVRE